MLNGINFEEFMNIINEGNEYDTKIREDKNMINDCFESFMNIFSMINDEEMDCFEENEKEFKNEPMVIYGRIYNDVTIIDQKDSNLYIEVRPNKYLTNDIIIDEVIKFKLPMEEYGGINKVTIKNYYNFWMPLSEFMSINVSSSNKEKCKHTCEHKCNHNNKINNENIIRNEKNKINKINENITKENHNCKSSFHDYIKTKEKEKNNFNDKIIKLRIPNSLKNSILNDNKFESVTPYKNMKYIINTDKGSYIAKYKDMSLDKESIKFQDISNCNIYKINIKDIENGNITIKCNTNNIKLKPVSKKTENKNSNNECHLNESLKEIKNIFKDSNPTIKVITTEDELEDFVNSLLKGIADE